MAGTLFWIFSHVTCYISIIVEALCISAGLYLLAEITEEYPTMTCKVLKYSTGILAVVQVLLWFDGLPAAQSLTQLIAYAAYGSTLRNFPFVDVVSLEAAISILLFLATNGIWLLYFIKSNVDIVSTLGFFLVVVWALPCGLLISLTSNNYVLPGALHEPKGNTDLNIATTKAKQKSIFRSSFDMIADYMRLVPGIGTILNIFRMMSDKKR